jgi:uncharacterized protein (DUF2147 family)
MKRTFEIDSFASREYARPLGLAALIAAALAAGPAASGAANDPHGTWLRPEGGVQFSFYDCDGGLCAKVIAAQNPEDRASIGAVILRGARQTGPNEWEGKLFNVEDGKTYDGFITVKTPTKLTLKGCLWGMLCSGETWTRLSGPPRRQAMAEPLP